MKFAVNDVAGRLYILTPEYPSMAYFEDVLRTARFITVQNSWSGRELRLAVDKIVTICEAD